MCHRISHCPDVEFQAKDHVWMQVAKDSENITINSIPEEVKITAESNNEISSEEAIEAPALNARDERNLDE
ncbi:hypothetical protein LOK49_LG06G01345 [Camellia lanceoleosa]|uniref:Uncharacterized protein n=1 Tax=Camellia lanceoleosa TaxID=1840588 RepID=A0ACC0HDN4_9ERIC|nr:hypothetical protein LOK49_LG06G01345 [Camellia lanceoleosa]